jgi:hypothetical protein
MRKESLSKSKSFTVERLNRSPNVNEAVKSQRLIVY